MAGNIFISYRRDDAAAWAGRLHMALERHFRREQIFMDVDSIQAGLDFAKVIDAEVAKCDVMLVVIGKDWIDARDAPGRRRLDDPGDFVRLEVESALRRDIRVVPVLVDGARLPKADDLPEGMQGLVRRQAWPLSHARFGAESEGLIGEISRYVSPAGGAVGAPARTDWAGEASKFFFYLLGGICLIAAVAGIGFAADYARLGRLPRSEGSPWATFVLLSVLWSILVGWTFFRSSALRPLAITSLWLTSIASALAWLGIVASVFEARNVDPTFVPFAIIAIGVAYIFLSGPALILWRRRQRRG